MPDIDSFSRPLHGLDFIVSLIPPMNRWAIVSRPLGRTGKGSALPHCAAAEPQM